jgi:hypothetical protein
MRERCVDIPVNPEYLIFGFCARVPDVTKGAVPSPPGPSLPWLRETETRMKTLICSVLPLLFVALTLSSCDNGTDSSGVTPVSYRTYANYYYQGPRPQSDTTLFLITTSKSAFDRLFMYMGLGLPVDTIPRADLNSQAAISIVKYGNDSYNLDIALAYLRGDTLQIEYTSTLLMENMSFTVAHSVIVMVNATFRAIKFYENGQLVKQMG